VIVPVQPKKGCPLSGAKMRLSRLAPTPHSLSVDNKLTSSKYRTTGFGNCTPRTVLEERRNRQEAEQRTKSERQRAKQKRRRAEEANERADQERSRAEDERRDRIEKETKTSPTTLQAYLRACRTLLSKPVCVQIDKRAVERLPTHHFPP